MSTMIIRPFFFNILLDDKNNKVLMDFIQVLQSKAAEIVLDRALDHIKQKTKAMLSFFA